MRILSTTIGAAVAGAVLASGAVFAATAALTPSDATTGRAPAASLDDTAADLRVPCGALLDRLPEALQEDLLALRDLSPAELPAARRELRRQALAGKYGDRVEAFARHRVAARHAAWRHLPADLRADLRQVGELPPEERAEALEVVGDAAVAGEYGPRADRVVTALRERRATCS